MLSMGPGSGAAFPVTICHGMHGIDAIDGLAPADKVSGSQHPGSPHEPAAPHATSLCGLWSASATFVAILHPEPAAPRISGRESEDFPALPVVLVSVVRTRFARAPPLLA